jgi:phosphate transport system protein
MKEEHAKRRRFHDELDSLQEVLMEMAGLVEQVIREAISAVLTRDGTVADRITDADDRIDELEVEIDARALELLALQQPMASDLRQIVTANKIANDLERMGDHAVNIANAARRLSEAAPLPEIRELQEMAEVVQGMVADALDAYGTRSAAKARMVCITDDRVDELRRSMFRILVTHMLEDPKRISGALELLLVSQNFERIGDLATNVCEDLVFLVEGLMIKHRADIHPYKSPPGS